MDGPTNAVLNELKGVRLRIFCYLLQQDGPVGVREVQRTLGLKSSSHSGYHLQKMLELGLVGQTPQNTYYLKKEYKVNSIKINVLTEYFLLWGRFWPRTVFFAVYLVMSLLFSIILITLDQFVILKIYIILSILLSLMIAAFEIKRELKALPWDETNSQ